MKKKKRKTTPFLMKMISSRFQKNLNSKRALMNLLSTIQQFYLLRILLLNAIRPKCQKVRLKNSVIYKRKKRQLSPEVSSNNPNMTKLNQRCQSKNQRSAKSVWEAVASPSLTRRLAVKISTVTSTIKEGSKPHTWWGLMIWSHLLTILFD